MAIDNDWLLENLASGYSLGSVDDAVDSLIGEYDNLINKITSDKRNYMMEAVSTMKEKIITSRVENVLELIDSNQFTDGDEFRTIGSNLTIVAEKYVDGETGSPAWTISKIEQEMENAYISVSSVEQSAITGGYLNSSNTVTKAEISSSSSAMPKSSSDVTVPFIEIESASMSDPDGILNIDSFITRYVPNIGSDNVDIIKLTIDNSLKNIVISYADVSFIEQDISDGELKGSGSKIADYQEIEASASASLYRDELTVILNYENDYTVNVGGVDYTYSSSSPDTAEDIATGLSDELGADANLSVSLDTGYWSTVFENGAGDKVFGWYAKNSDDSLSYEVEMIVPTEEGDLTIEQDASNPEKILITFEHDGFDPVYPTIADIRDLVNAFQDVDIRVVVMPGFDTGDEYSTADSVQLEIGASKIIIEASSDQTVTVSTLEAEKYEYIHVSDFSAATAQKGTVEIIKFNPDNTYYIEINSTRVEIDPSLQGNEYIVDEATLAQALTAGINADQSDVIASYSSSLITLVASSPGTSFTVSTSGEFNYVTPIDRDTLLRYDLRGLPTIGSESLPQLKKDGGIITNIREPLNNEDINKIVSSGMAFSDSYMMIPQVPTLVDNTNNFVPPVSTVAPRFETIVRSEESRIASASDLVSPARRNFPEAIYPMYATPQAKSNRWFFVEAGANSIAAKSTIGVAVLTISPRDYERLVLQDDTASFSTALENRIPNVGQKYESLYSLLKEDTESYNQVGDVATMPIRLDTFNADDIEEIRRILGNEVLEGFINYALLPQLSENDVDEVYKYLMELAMQIDDGLREQRFIALAGAYVVDASKLSGFYSDDKFADFVFGVNEPEAAPENNYGIGGIPIDATVTMSKLYFRNMRNQALALQSKNYALGTTVTEGQLIFHLTGSIHALTFPESSLYDPPSPSRATFNDGQWLMEGTDVSLGKVISIQIPDDTGIEDRLYGELVRTGFFSTNVDLALNHSPNGYSKKYNESVLALLTDAIEIADDGSIVSINSARVYLQSFYQSFDSLSPYELASMMLESSVYSGEADQDESIYSPLITVFLKVLLYFIENKDSIAYDDWEENFNKIIGLIFEADEFADEILPYSVFVSWVGHIGAHNSFTWKDDIVTSIRAIHTSSDLGTYISNSISKIEYMAGLASGGGGIPLGATPVNNPTLTWGTEEIDGKVVSTLLIEEG